MPKYSDHLEESLKGKDIEMVRSIILGYMDDDRTRKDFLFPAVAEYSEEILRKSGTSLFEQEDSEYILPSRENWDEDVWFLFRVKIQDNFSREKLHLMQEVMEYLRKNDESFQVKSPKQIKDISDQNKKKINQSQSNSLLVYSILFAAGGIAVGGVLTSKVLWSIFGGIVGAGIGYGIFKVNKK